MSLTAFAREGILYAADLVEAGDDPRHLRDGCRRGTLIRIRRGAYCERRTWDAADPPARHVLQIRATVAQARQPVIVAGSSAATVWGLPAGSVWPQPVTLLVPDRGGGTAMVGAKLSSDGFASAPTVTTRGLPVTSLARTAVDVARVSGFSDGVAIMDAVRDRRRAHPIPVGELRSELEAHGASARGVERARRAIGFSSDRAESVGESRMRVAIHRLGYVAPELQREFVDHEGSMFPDFYWPGVRVAIEFDGKVKYTDSAMTKGDPSEVVWKEKRREDRLRRLVSRVDRVVTYEVERPQLLDRILSNAGVPHRPRVTRPTTGRGGDGRVRAS